MSCGLFQLLWTTESRLAGRQLFLPLCVCVVVGVGVGRRWSLKSTHTQGCKRFLIRRRLGEIKKKKKKKKKERCIFSSWAHVCVCVCWPQIGGGRQSGERTQHAHTLCCSRSQNEEADWFMANPALFLCACLFLSLSLSAGCVCVSYILSPTPHHTKSLWGALTDDLLLLLLSCLRVACVRM